jgi:sugar phosphate isomerase/epimerase
MRTLDTISRRAFLGSAAAAGSLATAFGKFKKVPVGLELYSLRDHLKDPANVPTVLKAVKGMGYEVVEFYSPYFSWTTDQLKEYRKVMDDLGLKCLSTHNGGNAFDEANIEKAIDLNKILGSKYIVLASAGRVEGLDGWKKVAEKLAAGHEKYKKAGIRAGYHNHQVEFRELEGTKPIEIIAKGTPKDLMLQLDIGTCVEVGMDPVGWINANPGRIRCIHCKEYSKEKKYRVLFGEGDAPWKGIFEAAENKGGIEFYLIEQEGAEVPSMEAATKCLELFNKMRA